MAIPRHEARHEHVINFDKVIGTDASIKECIKEGYLMLEKEGKFSPSKQYHVFSMYPDYITEGKEESYKGLFVTNEYISADEVWELYQKHKKGIDSFIGDSYNQKPDSYDALLSMADSVNAYGGLN